MAESADGNLERTTLIAFAGAVVIGGANFLAVKFSNEELAPLFGAALRFASAALLLFAVARVRKIPLPRGRAAAGAAIWGLLGFGVAYGLLYYALVGLSAGTASVVTAAVPLVTLILAVLHRQERFSVRGVVGGILAIVGIAVLSAREIGGDIRPIYFLSSLCGVIAIAESTVVLKVFPRAHPIAMNAFGMGIGAVFLALASLAFSEEWGLPTETKTLISVGWLVIFGSAGLFGLFLYVIARWTASASAYALTLMPVVAVTLGALLADEELSLELVAGGLLVMSAVYIGALSGDRTGASPQPQPAGTACVTPTVPPAPSSTP